MTETIARFIGAHGVILIISLLVIIIFVILVLRHLFNRYSHYLWMTANAAWRWVRHSSPAQYLYQRYPTIWQFINQRLTALGYLGLHLGLGVLLTIIFILFFTNIAGAVVEGETLVIFDQALSEALHTHAQAYQVTAFHLVTSLAGSTATLLVGGVVGVILLVRKRYFLLTGWAVAVVGKTLLNSGLKMYFQRARPQFTEPFLTLSSWSFPSGHAMTAVVLYGMLTYLLFVIFKSEISKMLVIIITISLVLLIGFSRLYLGVHYFSDVVGGYVAGVSWLAVVISGTEVARRRQRLKLTQPPSP